MTFAPFARQFGGVAYREEDRGDDVGAGGGGDDEAAKAAEATAKAETDKAEADKVAGEKAAAEKAEREKNIAIPKDRFDAAVAKEREARVKAEKERDELRAAREAAQSSKDEQKIQDDIDKLEEDLDKALADNKPEEKKRLRQAIREKQTELQNAAVDRRAALASAQAVEQITYNGVVDRAEETYPFLVPDTADFNVDLATNVMAMKAGFEQQGLASSAALKEALKRLKPQLDAAKKAEKSGDEEAAAKAAKEAKEKADKAAAEAAAAAETDEGKKAKAEALEKKRREDAVAAGAAAQKAQGSGKPNAAGTADKGIKDPKVKEMSNTDFDKLPESELKRMRGDNV